MDTSNSMQFTVHNLEQSEHEEDNFLAARCCEVLEAILERIRPIAKYIVKPMKFLVVDEFTGQCGEPRTARCVELVKLITGYIYMSEQGFLFSAQDINSDAEKGVCRTDLPDGQFFGLMEKGDEGWKDVVFGDLLGAVQSMLANAEQLRQQHLDSVAERRKVLDCVMELVTPKQG